jgi:hypothetical protein
VRIQILVITALILCGSVGLGIVAPTRLNRLMGGATAAAPPLVVATTPTTTPEATLTPTAIGRGTSPTQLVQAAIPRATLPPVYTPTSIPPPPTATAPPPAATATPSESGASAKPVERTSSVTGGSPPKPAARIIPPTPSATLVPTSTATPTPSYDFIVGEIKEIPRPESRDTAYIRGRVVDANGENIKGAYFEIRSDAIPVAWTALYPHGTTPADGTAVFPVAKGRYSVRVVGGRSQWAGWMVTGQPGVSTMSDWEFTFQTTSPSASGLLHAEVYTPTPTSTNTPTTTRTFLLSPGPVIAQ